MKVAHRQPADMLSSPHSGQPRSPTPFTAEDRAAARPAAECEAERESKREAERDWDEVVAESFPASDPPPTGTKLGPPRRRAA